MFPLLIAPDVTEGDQGIAFNHRRRRKKPVRSASRLALPAPRYAARSDASHAKFRNRFRGFGLLEERPCRAPRARKVDFDGTPAVPREFVPKNLKSAPAADRNNTLDG